MAKITVRIPEPKEEYDFSNQKQINRTLTSYVKAIIGAEYVLRWLPIGTHSWNKFIKPEELESYLIKSKFKTLDIKGFEFNPILGKWKQSENLSVNYIICNTKD